MKPPLKTVSSDDFQTPVYALEPLYPYLKKEELIWECACGKGNLVRAFREEGYKVIGTDILTGHDFLTWEPPEYDCIITNPPFSLKQEFLERCYSLEKPFALLLPLTTLETTKRQTLLEKYGIEIILMDKRINFEVPGDGGNEKRSSWFSTAWFSWGFNIGKTLSFTTISKGRKIG